MKYLGVDTGVNTGLALWDSKIKKFTFIKTTLLHLALQEAKELFDKDGIDCIVIEDARLNKTTFGKKIPPYYEIKNQKQYNNAIAVIQRIGMVMRDAKAWEDFCKDNDIDYILVKPSKATFTKANPAMLRGYYNEQEIKRISEHACDAAMLVWGR